MDDHDRQPSLNDLDREVLDALAAEGFDADALDALTDAQRPRGEQMRSLLSLLGDYPVEDADDTLVHATLANINRYEAQAAAAMSFEAQRVGPRRGIRLPDFISVAAVMLIAVSVLWPVLGAARNRAIQNGCQDNMRHLAGAFATYTADHEGSMPMAVSGVDLPWESVRHIVNLTPLVSQGYCDRECLCCPGNAKTENASYSYQWHSPGTRVQWGLSGAVVLGDRNPYVDAYHRGERGMTVYTGSTGHGGRGQNVLAGDGSVAWLETPMTGNDHIYLQNGQSVLRGGTQPEAGDVFLTH